MDAKMIDKILVALKTKGQTHYNNMTPENGWPEIEHKDAVLIQLDYEGYIVNRNTPDTAISNRNYIISGKGLRLIDNGGFVGLEAEKHRKEEEAKQRQTLEQKQIETGIATNESSIATNKFVIDNTRKQNRLTVASIVVAGASALFALGAIVAQLSDSTDKEVRLLREQLQTQSQIQEKMLQSQKGIDSSMKAFLQRSDTSRH